MEQGVKDMKEFTHDLRVKRNANRDSSNASKRSVVVIGLDALDPILLLTWIDELPTFKSMIDEGTFGPMRSTIPPLTIPAWATMLTGKRPAKLGNFGLVDLQRDYSMKPVDPAIWRGQYVWDLLGARDRRVGILGLPFLASPYPVNGFLITDLTWGELKAFPGEISTRIQVKKTTGSMRNQIRTMWHNIEEEKHFILDALENDALDFFFFALTALDRSMHLGTRKEIKDAYRKADSFLSEIIPACKGRQILVVSDHGCKEATIALNVGTLLARMGFLQFRRAGQTRVRWGLARAYVSLVYRIPSLRLLLESLIDARVVRGWRESLVRPGLLDRIEMKDSRLFPVPMAGGGWFGIWINRVKDFDLGNVESGAEKKLLNSVTATLLKLRDPSSERLVVKTVLTREDLGYDRSSRFPDLVVQLQASYVPIFMDLPGRISLHYRELVHADQGVFLAVGPGIRKRHRLTGVELADVTPTVLHMQGMPVPDYMDGHVLSEIFETTSECATREVKREHLEETPAARPFLTDEEEERITDRLKALGYLD